jgi:hypothetical protein
VRLAPARDKHGQSQLYEPRAVSLAAPELDLKEDDAGYKPQGELKVPVVDTGENGIFTRGEFAAITALGPMEYITPEEIARVIVLEIRGANTGQDVISGMDANVMNPSYKAGLLRSAALTDLAEAEAESGISSVALGRLGPPELSKLLFESQLLKHAMGTMARAAAPDLSPGALSERLAEALELSGVGRMAPSIGIPILLPDGKTILRGPRINVPELIGHATTVPLDDPGALEGWITKGWVDLRPPNMERWQARFRKMLKARTRLRDLGSTAANIHTYMGGDSFEIGEVVAWIFNNEMGGYRVKS